MTHCFFMTNQSAKLVVNTQTWNEKNDQIRHDDNGPDRLKAVDSSLLPTVKGTGRSPASETKHRGFEVISRGKPLDSVWEIQILNSSAKERMGYPTKNPKPCLNASSKPPPTKATWSPTFSAAPAPPPLWPRSWAANGSSATWASSPSTPPASV